MFQSNHIRLIVSCSIMAWIICGTFIVVTSVGYRGDITYTKVNSTVQDKPKVEWYLWLILPASVFGIAGLTGLILCLIVLIRSTLRSN